MTDYEQFLESKRLVVPNAGIEVAEERINPHLFGFQKAMVRWALRKGRAGIFTGTGTGKTRMQLAWSQMLGKRTLIIAPLAVTRQTIREGDKIGVGVSYAQRQEEVGDGITITNYERVEHFDPDAFEAVVLDESSILKDVEGKTKIRLNEMFCQTPYRLAATATPAPNDPVELGNHAEFLGVCRYQEMLAQFFVNKGKTSSQWVLKPAARIPFYRFLASWSMAMLKPSDLGYSDEGYELPPLTINPHFVETDYQPTDRLFFDKLSGITERSAVRRETVQERVAKAVELIRAEPNESWLVWCGRNDESEEIAKALAAVEERIVCEVKGTDTPERKENALLAFSAGAIPILISKASICGHGMNWQQCARILFLGMNDSWEAYYQAIRRCYRFGQKREVFVDVVLSEPEAVVWDNVQRKQRESLALMQELVNCVADYERKELTGDRGERDYAARQIMRLPHGMIGRNHGNNGR